MKKIMQKYFDNWYKIMVRPIYFYTFMEKGPVKEEALSFAMASGWILSFFFAVAAMFLVLGPMLFGLISHLVPAKIIMILPVFAALFVVFFAIVLLVAAAVTVTAILVLLACAGIILDQIAVFLKGKPARADMVKACLYSSAVILVFILDVCWLIMAKYGMLSFINFLIGTNVLIFLTIIFLWGLWSIALRKVYGFSKTKSISATLIVVLIMLLLQLVGAIKILPILGRWIV